MTGCGRPVGTGTGLPQRVAVGAPLPGLRLLDPRRSLHSGGAGDSSGQTSGHSSLAVSHCPVEGRACSIKGWSARSGGQMEIGLALLTKSIYLALFLRTEFVTIVYCLSTVRHSRSIVMGLFLSGELYFVGLTGLIILRRIALY